jgi:tetratricopeptide (TPR) repeat protein
MNVFGRVLDFLSGGFLAKYLMRKAQRTGSEEEGPPDVWRSIGLFTRAIDVASSGRTRAHALYMRAWGWRYLHKYDEAMADYCRMIEIVPGDTGAYFQRALTYLGHHVWFDDPQSGPLDPDIVRATGAGRDMAIHDLEIAVHSLQDTQMVTFADAAVVKLKQGNPLVSGGIEGARQFSVDVMRMEAREYNTRLKQANPLVFATK